MITYERKYGDQMSKGIEGGGIGIDFHVGPFN